MWVRTVPPAYSPVNLPRALFAFASPSAEAALCAALHEQYGLHPILLDSGTSALSLALRLTGDDAARPVALPAFGCFDLATALVSAERRAILYDIDPQTLGPDWESVREALRAGADTLVVVHLFGIPVDLDCARALAEEFGAVLVEDAAQGVGATWRGRPLGASGDLSVLSFGRGKGLTGGGGGALLSRTLLKPPELAMPGWLGSLKAGATLVLQDIFSQPRLYGIPASFPFLGLGLTHFHPPAPPRQMYRWSARVLLDALDAVPSDREGRSRTAQYLSESLVLAGLPTIEPGAAGAPGWLRYPLLLPDPSMSLGLPTRLGIARSYPITLDALAPLRGLVSTAKSVNGASTLASRLVTLPTHRWVSAADRRRMRDWIRSLASGTP